MSRLLEQIYSLITGTPIYSDYILTKCPHCDKIIAVKRFDEKGNTRYTEDL